MSQKIAFLSVLQVYELQQNRRWGVKYPPLPVQGLMSVALVLYEFNTIG